MISKGNNRLSPLSKSCTKSRFKYEVFQIFPRGSAGKNSTLILTVEEMIKRIIIKRQEKEK